MPRQWKRWRSARRCADTLPTEKARVNAEKTAECLPRELQAGPKTQSMLGARKEKKKSHRNVRCKWDDGGIGKTASVRGEGAQEALARQRSDIWGDGAKLSVLWLFCTPDHRFHAGSREQRIRIADARSPSLIGFSWAVRMVLSSLGAYHTSPPPP